MSEQKFTYKTVGQAESVSIKVADPSKGFAVLKQEPTEAQAEAGFLGKRLLIHSDHGTIGLDVWESNQEQLKAAVATLSTEGGELTVSRTAQHRYDEEGLKDITDGVPNVYYNWSLPRVGISADDALAAL